MKEIISVNSSNMRKNGPEKTLNEENFHAVYDMITWYSVHAYQNNDQIKPPF